ncbi:hypothetical protein, partial [Escherichia coli]|uniref:hypothetical protein n=1 Tax=Escherichia coli TaxID=562 RepID=UPI001AA1882D
TMHKYDFFKQTIREKSDLVSSLENKVKSQREFIEQLRIENAGNSCIIENLTEKCNGFSKDSEMFKTQLSDLTLKLNESEVERTEISNQRFW